MGHALHHQNNRDATIAAYRQAITRVGDRAALGEAIGRDDARLWADSVVTEGWGEG